MMRLKLVEDIAILEEAIKKNTLTKQQQKIIEKGYYKEALELEEDFNTDSNEKLYYDIASQVRKEFVDKYGNNLTSQCIDASDRIVELLKEEGISAKTVDKYIFYDFDHDFIQPYEYHSWVETADGYYIDVTADQFNHIMDYQYPEIIVSTELPPNYSYSRDYERLDEKWKIANIEQDVSLDAKQDPYKHQIIEEALTEAKKSKKKRKNQTQNNPVFKNVDDLKKWVKKRQKGLSPFTTFNSNAGNVLLGNAIFNGMFSADGGSGAGVSDGGISNGGLSAPVSDGGGMAMGEALSNNDEEKNYIEISSSSYLRQYKHLLDDHLDEFIAELYKFCDEKVYLNIINMLKEADIELPNPQHVLDRMIELGYMKDAQKSTLLQLEKDLGQQ